jgi:DNA-directed RNA polymerase subunit K
MIAKQESNRELFTKYEIARILGARALQIAMDAPLLLKVEKEQLEEVRYDPLRVAEIEFNAGVLPITVKRPFPKKIEVGLRRETDHKPVEENAEQKEEKDIKESGEIMELTTPEDEVEASESESEEDAI